MPHGSDPLPVASLAPLCARCCFFSSRGHDGVSVDTPREDLAPERASGSVGAMAAQCLTIHVLGWPRAIGGTAARHDVRRQTFAVRGGDQVRGLPLDFGLSAKVVGRSEGQSCWCARPGCSSRSLASRPARG